MSICGTCKAETTRIRTVWGESGDPRDECPSCNPQGFEKFSEPSTKKIWMGYEANPNQYEKRYDADGVIYERKPEYRAEQEQQLMGATEDERNAQVRAMQRKRAERRTTPMTREEYQTAMRRAEEIASWMVASANQGTDIN